jgi:type 2A phosphatase activator TIP41
MEPSVEDFGGSTLSSGGIRLHGWKFESSDGAIASTSDIASLKKRLQEGAGTDETLPKLPEAIFLQNKLTVTHEATGSVLSFDAESALLQWLKTSLVNGAGGYTIPAASLGTWKDKVKDEGETGSSARPEWDWTYSTEFAGDGADREQQPLGWASHSGPGIDMALLRRRDPILFFADLPLYTDDLHDNGVSEARVRVRVMPSCFFVLMRHWLRIDGTLIRQRDSRFFAKFDGPPSSTPSSTPPSVIRHVRVAQLALPPLPTGPPPDEDASIGDGRRYVEGGETHTPRPGLNLALPDEQVAAERLAAVEPESEQLDALAVT